MSWKENYVIKIIEINKISIDCSPVDKQRNNLNVELFHKLSSRLFRRHARFGRNTADAFHLKATWRHTNNVVEINYSMNISFGSFESKQSSSHVMCFAGWDLVDWDVGSSVPPLQPFFRPRYALVCKVRRILLER